MEYGWSRFFAAWNPSDSVADLQGAQDVLKCPLVIPIIVLRCKRNHIEQAAVPQHRRPDVDGLLASCRIRFVREIRCQTVPASQSDPLIACRLTKIGVPV